MLVALRQLSQQFKGVHVVVGQRDHRLGRGKTYLVLLFRTRFGPKGRPSHSMRRLIKLTAWMILAVALLAVLSVVQSVIVAVAVMLRVLRSIMSDFLFGVFGLR